MINHIKDSANNYTLYLAQGTDYSLDIPSSIFGYPLEYKYPSLYVNTYDLLSMNADGDILALSYTTIPAINPFGLLVDDINTLQVDADSNLLIDIPYIDKISQLDFIGGIKQHHTSRLSYNITIEKNLETQSISLIIPPVISNSMTELRYNFDINYRDSLGNIKRAIGGSVINNQNFSGF